MPKPRVKPDLHAALGQQEALHIKHIDTAKPYSSRQRQAPCCISRQSSTPRARLGGSSAFAVFSRSADYHVFRSLSNHMRGFDKE
ncbi:hypothetical protein QE152_g37008 [Popillia japonica]|uniref:Uncharacterized protein n=1 Tax=Popillia japonica TaxID=7064 RepID=A0AAW1IC47_POPJA